MSNKPTITASPFYEEDADKWYDSLDFTYFVSGMENNGTSQEDSMSPMNIKFLVPEGQEATLGITLGVDDWGSVVIKEENKKVGKRTLLEIDMTREHDNEIGPRGGHAYREQFATVNLSPGKHTISITHENVTYDPTSGYDSRYNDAKCRFLLTANKKPIKVPQSIEVNFDTRCDTKPVIRTEKKNSFCASGYVFEGTATVHYVGTDETRSFPVQTGGWMSADSPFYRAGNHPSASDAANWNYNPTDYPDTAFPAFDGSGTLSTTRGGNTVDGFEIKGYPSSSGRSDLYLHVKERYGSEGCVSTGTSDWEVFCAEMKKANESGKFTIPITVTYLCPDSPDPSRNLTHQ